ncbi:hypothetical protein T11_2529 [Trichinella zimbabwensis]|uniref:Uncharacterized protein n=1 Tax=Trichinella zimbabwensis TaxID=268475 RepID=A0A0V1I6B5_9BILA|nr:hypothetical protein T11_2529 [Trichinella zimbabwensis]
MSVDSMTVALFHRQEQNREVGFDRSRVLLLACSGTPGVKMQAESAPHRCRTVEVSSAQSTRDRPVIHRRSGCQCQCQSRSDIDSILKMA